MCLYKRISIRQVGVRLSPRKKPVNLKPGVYWYNELAGTRIKSYPTIPTAFRMPGQEVFTKDHVPVKVTCALMLHYTNPAALHEAASEPEEFLITTVINAIHTEIRTIVVEDLAKGLSDFEVQLKKEIQQAVAPFGVEIDDVRVRNLVLPRSLKNAYSAESTARVEARAKLEMARSQTAALRHLANAAKMVEDQPELVQLLALQSTSVELSLPARKSK